MSNRNQYAQGTSSGSQDYYQYSGGGGGDSGNYGTHGYRDSGPSAPRGAADGVEALQGDFSDMSMQDGSPHGPYPYYSHSTQPYYAANHDPYSQTPQYNDSPLDPSHSSSAKAKSSKSKQKPRGDPKDKSAKKSHGRRPDKSSGIGPEFMTEQEPFYPGPTRSQTDTIYVNEGSGHGVSQQSEDPATYQQGQGFFSSDGYSHAGHPESHAGQDYQQGGYPHANPPQEDFQETPQDHYQQGSYSHADHPGPPLSSQGHKHKGKQRQEYADAYFQEETSYPEVTTSEHNSGYQHPHSQYEGLQAQDDGQYRQEAGEYQYGYSSGEPEKYPRSQTSKGDSKSSSGKRSKREARRDIDPPPPEEYTPELQAIAEQADGYSGGYAGESPYAARDGYYPQGGQQRRVADESGMQTPRQRTPLAGNRSATTMPLTREAGIYEPYPTTLPGSYAQPVEDTDTGYDQSYDQSYEPAAYGRLGYEETTAYGPGYGSVRSGLHDSSAAGDSASSSGEIDSRYVIEHSSRFDPGEVFKVLWPEPRGFGQSKGRDDKQSEAAPTEFEEQSHMGEKFHIGFRRFIVVANDEGHCTCVPILTYERRACTKKGVKPQKHGIVYAPPGPPTLLRGEPQLGFEPVRLHLDYQTEKLAIESRVNYSKLVTIEHNVKVFFIGRISPDDLPIVHDAVDRCWLDKKRDHRDHRPRDHRDHRDNRDHRDRRRDRR